MQIASDSRILIARMTAIGDTILTLPVLCALRAHFPRAFIAWVVETGAAPVLRGHDCLDHLIVLPRRWFTSLTEIRKLRRELRALAFDITLDAQSINKTALACRLSGAPLRIGSGGVYAREWSAYLNNHPVSMKHPHLTDRSLELLRPLGILSPPVEFRIPRHAGAEKIIAAALLAAGLRGPFAVLNPGASWDSKLWPPERYAEVATHLAEVHGMPSMVVWAGTRELGWARTIVGESGGSAVLAPKTDLLALTALLRAADLFVGSDTGPLHLAVAVGTPSIGLYGTTRPEDCGPYGPPHVAIQVYYQSGSRRERRNAANDAMRAIGCERVCRACDGLLARQHRKPAAAARQA